MNEQINEDDAARMTLVEHLVELRRRLIICAIAIVVCSAIMFLLYNRVLHFLSGPYEQVTKGDTSCGGTATHGCDLIVTDPLGPAVHPARSSRATAGSRSQSRSSSGRSGGS